MTHGRIARIASAALLSSLAVALCAAAQSTTPVVEARTASTHPIHYYVSLPVGWTAAKRWPTVIVITDAEREFEKTARAFAAARGARPFIIVVPLQLSGGGSAQQHKAEFDYSPATWAYIDSVTNCRFDEDGMTAVLRDVQRLYGSDDRVFLTGWEAGGHVVVAQLFAHPERIRAVAVVTPNYQGRCVTSATRAPSSLAAMPVRGFHGSADTLAWGPGRPLFMQWPRVDSAARSLGFTNVADTLIPRQGHGALAVDVMNYFASLLGR